MYLNCKHEVRECDRYVMFDLDLSNSASDFKTIYEERFPHALVWEAWQNKLLFLPPFLSDKSCLSAVFKTKFWYRQILSNQFLTLNYL